MFRVETFGAQGMTCNKGRAAWKAFQILLDGEKDKVLHPERQVFFGEFWAIGHAEGVDMTALSARPAPAAPDNAIFSRLARVLDDGHTRRPGNCHRFWTCGLAKYEKCCLFLSFRGLGSRTTKLSSLCGRVRDLIQTFVKQSYLLHFHV